jgi:adenylyltransferase/sulfurtransferase
LYKERILLYDPGNLGEIMNHTQEIRYSRQLCLPEIGKAGQEKLLKSKVLVIGAGGLGSPLLLYLAASGVGTIGIIDDDKVELSNLQRQVLHETGDVGVAKTQSARDALSDLNPDITITCCQTRLDEGNIDNIIANYDIIADGSDNFSTRFLVNDRCFSHGKTLVSAAIQGFTGQLSTFKAHLGQPHPCYRCIYPEIPPRDTAPPCSETGILGGVAGIMGTWQSIEIIKELVGFGESLSGSLVIFDALTSTSRKVKVRRNTGCLCCANIPAMRSVKS